MGMSVYRYEAFICCGNEVDALAEGNLDPLLLHLPEVQELNAKGSKASIKLQPPASSAGTTWFTKSTISRLFWLQYYNLQSLQLIWCIFVNTFACLLRFLQIVGSPELMNIMKTMNEMSQLEETKKFHLSLYGQVVVHAIFQSRFPIMFPCWWKLIYFNILSRVRCQRLKKKVILKIHLG